MKTLLLFPRFEPNANPPLGIAYIAACLRQAAFDVEVLDPTFQDWNFAVERLQKADYDVLGIGSYTMNYNNSKKLAAVAKQVNSNVLTVFGGPHPTIVPESTIADKEVDAICIGEGEQTFAEIAGRIESGKSLEDVKGIWYKEGKKIVKNPPRPFIQNLDELPFPARDMLPMHDYLNAKLGRAAWSVKQPSTSIITGRGCPFNCTYCSTKLMFGKAVRFRSVENVMREIEQLKQEYGINGLAFVDDTFTLSPKLVNDLCNEMIKHGTNIEWACHTRLNNASPDLFKKMHNAGCRLVVFGIESGNQYVLDNFIKKGINLKDAEKVLRWSKQAGITTGAYFMLGIPGESKENMYETIEFAKKLQPDVVNFNITRPMPKTEMYEIAEKHGTITANSWDDFDFAAKPIFYSKEWDIEFVEEMFRKAHKEFYFTPRYILKQLLGIRHASDIKKLWHGAIMVARKAKEHD